MKNTLPEYQTFFSFRRERRAKKARYVHLKYKYHKEHLHIFHQKSGVLNISDLEFKEIMPKVGIHMYIHLFRRKSSLWNLEKRNEKTARSGNIPVKVPEYL